MEKCRSSQAAILRGGLLAGNRETNGTFANQGTNANFWSSTVSAANAWNRNLNSGQTGVNRNPNSQAYGFSVRCLKDWLSRSSHGVHCEDLKSCMSSEHQQILYDLFQAYDNARKHKRSTASALAFEINYERNLFELHREIVERRYTVRPCFCFVSKKPVLREVFAADFRDRVVHHLVYNYISPFFERLFIDDSYSCRTGKGTSYGIKRVEHFIRSCSDNYQKDCYILKLDISGYFMSIDRSLLYAKVEKDILRYKDAATFDVDLLLHLIRTIIFHDPTAGCVVKGDKQNWVGLPKSKSLFFAKPNRGLPIGNLTSQLFGNVYLNDFDHFVKCRLGCRYYGRYVDDFVLIHPDKDHLKAMIPVIARYLEEHLYLELHRRKIYLQHVATGMLWLGVFIKPHRKYIRNRTKGNFYASIRQWNAVIEKAGGGALSERTVGKFIATMNAYLGMLKQCNTFKLRQKLLHEHLSPAWQQYVRITDTGIIEERS